MIREIYCRMPSDRSYKKNVESTDEIENILTQIKVVLGTHKGQVLGSFNFGINLNDYIFNYNFNDTEIQYLVNSMLAQYVYYDTRKYNVYAQVSWGHADDNSDYGLIDVYINERACLGILVDQN